MSDAKEQMEKLRSEFEVIKNERWFTAPVSHGETAYASWEYQLWLENELLKARSQPLTCNGGYSEAQMEQVYVKGCLDRSVSKDHLTSEDLLRIKGKPFIESLGWIEIKSDKDLPKIGVLVEIALESETILIGRLMNNGWTAFFKDGEQLTKTRPVTHWKKIIPPNHRS